MNRRIVLLLTVCSLSLVLPAALQAQDTQPKARKTLDPPGWSSWRPYQPPVETDTLGWRWTPEEARQFGLVPPTRWMALDPLADDYPGWSPYNYVLNNPITNIDPDGREVRCKTQEDCQRATEDIQELYADAPVNVEKRTETRSRFSVFGIKFGGTVTEEYYVVTIDGERNFDWGQDQYAGALYDVIASEDVIFNLAYQETGPVGNLKNVDLQGAGGGIFDPISSTQATVYVDPRGDQRTGDPSSIILMHELVGHGHPVATPSPSTRNNAHDINRFYHQKLGLTPRTAYRNPHRGYKGELRWPRIGLHRRQAPSR